MPTPEEQRAAEGQRAADFAAMKQQESLVLAQLAEAGDIESRMAPLLAQEKALKKKTSMAYVGPYLGLTVFAGIVDLSSVFDFVPFLELIPAVFGILFSFFRFMVIRRVNVGASRTQKSSRNMRTIIGAIIELIPFVNILPAATTLMIVEWTVKRQEISAANNDLRLVREQMKKLAAGR